VLSEASDRATTAIAGRAFSVAPSESMKEHRKNERPFSFAPHAT
jgi:hypothetical protein